MAHERSGEAFDDAQHVSLAGLSTTDSADEVLSAVADRIYALGEEAGFAGQRVEPSARSITVWWKGKAPMLVKAFAESRPSGFTVRIHESARWSRTESLAAAERLIRSKARAEIGITSVAVKSDGSGVTARVSGALPKAAAGARAVTVARVAVSYERRAPFIHTATRANDSPAWKGGARTLQAGNACSTGFAVLAGAQGRLLSAHHCDKSADARVTDGAGSSIAPGGSSVAGIGSIDSQLIDPSASPATTPRVYTGAWNSGTTAVVKNWARNWNNERVCTSGATSGQHCGVIVNDATVLPWTQGGFYVEAQAANRGPMVAGGDSGGPVFASTSGGVQARGIILASSDPVPCGATNPDVKAECGNNVVYAPISVLLNTWGVKLEVG